MKTRHLTALLAAVVVLAALVPCESSAIPVFARKYGFNCSMCHSAYPRLNDFGARYRANGYRLPGRENVERTILESPTPVALRTSAGYTFYELKHLPDATPTQKQNGLALTGLDILSAGLLGPNIGYFMVFVPGINEARGLAGQEASLEMASVVFSNLAGKPLTLRAGRFEPAYAAFSVRRQLSASPYEVYDYSFEGGPKFSDTQTGIEVRGGGHGPARVVAGLVEGSGTNLAEDPPQDGYVRVEGLLGAGEGQTVGHRVGLTGYLGRARPDTSLHSVRESTRSFSRVGVDASLNASGVNLALQYLWARDDGALWGRDEKATWWGGFAELSYTSDRRAMGFARIEMVKEPSFLDRDIKRYTAGGRYYFEDNVATHLEYSHQIVASSAPDDATEDFLTLRLDFAF